MRLQPHLAASTAAGAAVWAGTGEPITLPIAIAAGVLPDADHLLDYYLKFVKKTRRFRFYLLHGWEYLIAGLVIYLFFVNEPWMLAIVTGYATQIILDQISHARETWPLAYFVTYRALTKFRAPPPRRPMGRRDYDSFVQSLPFGRGVAERWFRNRIGPK